MTFHDVCTCFLFSLFSPMNIFENKEKLGNIIFLMKYGQFTLRRDKEICPRIFLFRGVSGQTVLQFFCICRFCSRIHRKRKKYKNVSRHSKIYCENHLHICSVAFLNQKWTKTDGHYVFIIFFLQFIYLNCTPN